MKYKNAWEEYKAKNGVTPFDLLNKHNYIEKEESDKRMDICLSCPKLIQSTRTCKECGCFMSAKTRLAAAKCPLGKW